MNATRKNRNSIQKCQKTYCEKVWLPRQKQLLNNITRKLKIKFPKSKSVFKSRKNFTHDIQSCTKAYCNPSCSKTMFQSGKDFPRGVTGNKALEPYIKNTRKSIFGKKTNVLKDGFYEGLSKSDLKGLKESGAISGCAIKVL